MAFIQVPPTQKFDGNDGPWSSFTITVGTPGDTIRVLPATDQYSIWCVLSGNGPDSPCPEDAPSDCSNRRGGTFNPDNSSSYKSLADHGRHGLPLQAVSPLLSNVSTWGGAGAYTGTDSVLLGAGGTAGAPYNMLIASYVASEPFVGVLGLMSQNATVTEDDREPSLLAYLSQKRFISSTLWAYTAGSYRKKVVGSLTFGGYDSVRGNTQNVMTGLLSSPSEVNLGHDLQLDLTGIKIGSRVVSMDTPLTYFIDSFTPEIWLPDEVCDQFASIYGLNWEPTYELYTVNDSQRTKNLQSAPSVELSLAALGDASNTTTITMSYESFDLQVQWPYAGVDDSVAYFPIKKAANSSQYFLGRAFLQDAYLVVDYDRAEFNVSQAQPPVPATKSTIIPVVNSTSKSSGLSGGAIAGIVIGVVAVIALLLGATFWWRRRKRQQKKQLEKDLQMSVQNLRSPNSDVTTIVANLEEQQVEEHFKPYITEPVEADSQVKDFKPELHGQSHEAHELYGDYVETARELSGEYVATHDQTRSPMTVRSESFDTLSPPLSDQTTPPIGTEDSTRSWFGGPFELHNTSRPHHTRQPSSMSQPSIPEEEVPRGSPSQATVSPVQEHEGVEDDVNLRGTRNTLTTPNDLAARIVFVGRDESTMSERQHHVFNDVDYPEERR